MTLKRYPQAVHVTFSVNSYHIFHRLKPPWDNVLDFIAGTGIRAEVVYRVRRKGNKRLEKVFLVILGYFRV